MQIVTANEFLEHARARQQQIKRRVRDKRRRPPNDRPLQIPNMKDVTSDR